MVSTLNRFSKSIYFAIGLGYLALLIHKYLRRNQYCSDFPEVHGAMIIYGGLGLSAGIVMSILIYNSKNYDRIKYILSMLLRYSLAYFLISYGISQVIDARFPESLLNQDMKIAELTPNQLVWTFFGYTYAYQAFIGWAQLIGCCLLFYRFTTPLGLLMLSVIMGNAVIINYSYGLCTTADAFIFLSLITYLFIPFLRNFLNITVLNKPAEKVNYPLFTGSGHGYKALNILKLVVIIGIMIFYYNPYRRYLRYYHSNADSPVVGVWNIEQIEYDTSLIGSKEEAYLRSFQSLFLEKRRLGAVKADDSLSFFEYMIDTNYHQLEFWNFHEYRSLDLKGKYSMPSPDTLIYNGYNNKHGLQMKLSLDKRYKSREK